MLYLVSVSSACLLSNVLYFLYTSSQTLEEAEERKVGFGECPAYAEAYI